MKMPTTEEVPLHSLHVPGFSTRPWACAKPEGPYTSRDCYDPRCSSCMLALSTAALQTPDSAMNDWIVGDQLTIAEALARYSHSKEVTR